MLAFGRYANADTPRRRYADTRSLVVRLLCSAGLGLVSQRQFEPLPGGRPRIDWGITVLMFAVFIAGLFWFTHGNGFPPFYHPEEEIRASQLIKGDRDLHHPLLSAVTTKLLKTVLHVPDDLRAVVQL